MFLAAVAGGGTYGLNWWKLNKDLVTTDNAYIRGHVTVISALVTGEIEEVHVLNNDFVTAGEPLVSFKPAGYEAAVDAQLQTDAQRARVRVKLAVLRPLLVLEALLLAGLFASYAWHAVDRHWPGAGDGEARVFQP